MRYLWLVILAGCSTTNINDKYSELSTCLNVGGDCSQIQEEINRLEAIAERRKYQRTRRCPVGMIEHCNDTHRGCGKRWKQPDDEFVCVHRSQLPSVFH